MSRWNITGKDRNGLNFDVNKKNSSSLIVTKDQKTLYACVTNDCFCVTKFVRNDEESKWDKAYDLPRSATDDTEVVLQLKLDKDEKVLYG